PDEVVLDGKTAKDEHFALGDHIKVQTQKLIHEYEIVGLAGFGSNGTDSAGTKVVVFDTPTAQTLLGKEGVVDCVEAAAEPGVTQQQLARTLRGDMPHGTQVITGKAYIEEQQAEVAKIISVLTTFILAFGWISIFVATFIIYNTFSILITQR